MTSYSPGVSSSVGSLPASRNSRDETLKQFFPRTWFGGTEIKRHTSPLISGVEGVVWKLTFSTFLSKTQNTFAQKALCAGLL